MKWAPAMLALGLAGCIADPAAHQAAKTAATEAYAACTMDAVRRLDDGRSDPASIAMGVAGACTGQYGALTNVMVDEMSTENSQAFMRNKMRGDELRTATAAVLTYRAAKRSN